MPSQSLRSYTWQCASYQITSKTWIQCTKKKSLYVWGGLEKKKLKEPRKKKVKRQSPWPGIRWDTLLKGFCILYCAVSFWHGQGCPLFGVGHPAFPLPTTASPTLQDALKDGFWAAAEACGMPEPSHFRLSTVARTGSCGPTRSWSCSAPSRWYFAPSRRYREVSSCTCLAP